MKAIFFLALAVACAVAVDEPVKKEVSGVLPVIPGIHAIGIDDGKYYPGKYEKSSIIPYTGAYPYSYGGYPYSYGGYPYHYGAYPYHHYGYNYPFAGSRHIVY